MARRRSGRRADYRWTFGTHSFTGLAAGGNTAGTIVTAGNTSQTLMRVRGSFLAWLDATGSAAADTVIVAAGLLVQQGGAASTSLPITDGDAPWLWHASFTLATEIAFPTGGDGQPGILWVREEVDNKAMRVVRPDQEIELVVETLDVVGAPVINFSMSSRFLFAD